MDCTIPSDKKDPFELARMMRGKVPELDDTYVEKWLPEEILKKILNIPAKCNLVDEDGGHHLV